MQRRPLLEKARYCCLPSSGQRQPARANLLPLTLSIDAKSCLPPPTSRSSKAFEAG